MIKNIIESSQEHLNTYKISFLFNGLIKSYGLFCFTTFSMESICHTFANFGTTKAINTAQKMKFFIKDFFSKCDQIRRKLRIWSHLLKKSLMKNIIFCAVKLTEPIFQSFYIDILLLSKYPCHILDPPKVTGCSIFNYF